MTAATWAVRAEWVKLRTVRGWVAGLILVPVLTALLSVLIASGRNCGFVYPGANGQPISGGCTAPVGPGGELVEDQFYFVHQTLTGAGSITTQLTSLTSNVSVQPWAKAGIIIKASAVPGSAYAAMVVTGAHGVRMQWNYTGDTAGLPGQVSAASPRWLRLVRSGDTITGYDSADGTRWTKVGSVTLAGFPAAAQAGLLATTPMPPGQGNVEVGSAPRATGTFGRINMTGSAAGTWTGTSIGANPGPGADQGAGYQQTGSGFTVTGSGDIAPDTGADNGGTATAVAQALDGLFGGLIVVIIVGVVFVTAEYRRGLMRVTLAATRGRGRVLAAKALVAGAVTFAVSLIGFAVALPLSERILRNHGNVVEPVSGLTEVRMVVGVAAVFGLIAVLGVALGTIFRSGAGAVMTGIALVVVPWFLAVATPGLPATLDTWLMRLSPDAALAVLQTIPKYPQVAGQYLPFNGFYPLTWWAGFAVLLAWVGGALALAARLLDRRDA
jgi:ABC-type transport system involved in multi-copper enzyme maturation permease subunit